MGTEDIGKFTEGVQDFFGGILKEPDGEEEKE